MLNDKQTALMQVIVKHLIPVPSDTRLINGSEEFASSEDYVAIEICEIPSAGISNAGLKGIVRWSDLTDEETPLMERFCNGEIN